MTFESMTTSELAELARTLELTSKAMQMAEDRIDALNRRIRELERELAEARLWTTPS